MEPITRREMFLAKAAGQDVVTPTPESREEKLLAKIAEGGGHGGGSSAPADWNASEGQPGHVLNRTHWEEKDATVVVEERELSFSSQQAILEEEFPVVPGEVYTVYFDGVPYQCRCREAIILNMRCYALGNERISLSGIDTGEPFIVGTIPQYASTVVAVTDTETTHTIKITKSNVIPLDDRYVNDTFCVTVTFDEFIRDEDRSVYSIKETAEEILQAYYNGKNIVCKLVIRKGPNSHMSHTAEHHLNSCTTNLVVVSDGTGIVTQIVFSFGGMFLGYALNDKLEMVRVKFAIGIYGSSTEFQCAIGELSVDGLRYNSPETFDPYLTT